MPMILLKLYLKKNVWLTVCCRYFWQFHKVQISNIHDKKYVKKVFANNMLGVQENPYHQK